MRCAKCGHSEDDVVRWHDGRPIGRWTSPTRLETENGFIEFDPQPEQSDFWQRLKTWWRA